MHESSSDISSGQTVVRHDSGNLQNLTSSAAGLQAVRDTYGDLHAWSIRNPDEFWTTQARSLLVWEKDFDTVHEGTFQDGDLAWFSGGRLNASYNCVDRWAAVKPDAPALIYEPDEPNDPVSQTLSFKELQREICRAAWTLKSLGVAKGDTIIIYLPMVPEAVIAPLACARIGAVHSIVFAGFSTIALRDRIIDTNAKLVITSDEGLRGSKKNITDKALEGCPNVRHCLVLRRTGTLVQKHERDRWWHEETIKWPAVYPPESMCSEDPLFLLYTSGSTGKPKGLMHTTAGFLLGAALSTKHVFDVQEHDIFFCAGDLGWITGHTYLLYGPLALGCTTLIFEGTLTYPSVSRYWDIIAKHKVTQFYSAPTALRLLKKAGNEHVRSDMSSHLRVLGSVGEPLAANVWERYNTIVGRGRAHVVDTFFQTESGSHLIAPLAGITRPKPGCCCLPFFGVEAVILDPVRGVEIIEPDVEGVLAIKRPIPSMARSVWGDHARFLATYYQPYPGYYFSGDAAVRDIDGYFWIKGRVDDVINVSAHRLSTAEIESALLKHPLLTEVAVIGVPDTLTGQAVTAFISTKAIPHDFDIERAAIEQVKEGIGKFAVPKIVVVVPDLPKTRSGKIMRRLLRKIWCGEIDSLGDISTLVNPASIDSVIQAVDARSMSVT